jgi:hypothetical protein
MDLWECRDGYFCAPAVDSQQRYALRGHTRVHARIAAAKESDARPTQRRTSSRNTPPARPVAVRRKPASWPLIRVRMMRLGLAGHPPMPRAGSRRRVS